MVIIKNEINLGEDISDANERIEELTPLLEGDSDGSIQGEIDNLNGAIEGF
jgi:hypothetical protein